MTVLCLGEMLWDYLAEQPGNLESVQSWFPQPGGAPANVATALVKLGTPAAFLGCLGQDNLGKQLYALLEEIGVDTRGIQWAESAPTRRVYVTRREDGERSFAGFGEMSTTSFADTRFQAEGLRVNWFAEAKYLVTGTLGLAYPSMCLALYCARELAREHGVRCAIDLNWRSVFWEDELGARELIRDYLQGAFLLKCSEEEAFWLLATTNPAEIAAQLTVAGVCITAGEKGCRYYYRGWEGEIPAFRVRVVDTTGAGDSFWAGFLHRCYQDGEEVFAHRDRYHQALVYASAVGALTASRLGAIAAQPRDQEVASFLSNRGN